MMKAIRARMNPTTILAVAALVFAMTGGAYAAKKYLITSTKQISPSVLKQLQGKAGANGAPGAAGAAGAKGENGAAGGAGPQGPQGPQGEKGTNGTNGENVTIAKASASECKEGGTKFSDATGTGKACNGSPWAAGGTLPIGSTETGSWSFGPVTTSGRAAIPFAIPLAAALDGAHVHYINPAGKEINKLGEEVTSAACKGEASAPTAVSGNLCVYAAKAENILVTSEFVRDASSASGAAGAGIAGSDLEFFNEGTAEAWGTFAVTG